MARFNVINLATEKLIEDRASGLPWSTANGNEAARMAERHTQATGQKHQPRAVKAKSDGTWRDRERKRFEDGTYLPIKCWETMGWWREGIRTPPRSDHFAHVSRDFPGKVAFTEDDAHGAEDRQTVIRAGTYLKRYFGNWLMDNDIKHCTNLFSVAFKETPVKLAQTPDEIEWVYCNGPGSCMSHNADHFCSPEHPTRIYAAGDLAVAYILKNGDEERVSARALVWPARKIYGRIYGEEARLDAALQMLGYHDDYHGQDCYGFIGAKMRRVEYRGALVMPYIDGLNCATDTGKVTLMGYVPDKGKKVHASRTDGMTNSIGTRCSRCEEYFDQDEICRMRNGDYLCEGCLAEMGGWMCEGCERYCTEEHDRFEVQITRTRTGSYCNSCRQQNTFYSDHSETYFHANNNFHRVSVRTQGGVQHWAEHELANNSYTCGLCALRWQNGHSCGRCVELGEQQIAWDMRERERVEALRRERELMMNPGQRVHPFVDLGWHRRVDGE